MPEEMVNHLSVVHESAWKSMKDVYQALWTKVEQVPEDMVVLAEQLRRARCRLQALKVSAYREDAREA